MEAPERDRDQLLFELDEKGANIVVKSIESRSRALLRFTNKTSRPVDVCWRDYQGLRKCYVRLSPGTAHNIDTYLTHPWEFIDVATNDKCVINNRQIFRAPENLGGMLFRTNWNITVGVRDLRRSAMLVLAQHIKYPEAVATLGLPLVLATELKVLITAYHRPKTPPAPVPRD